MSGNIAAQEVLLVSRPSGHPDASTFKVQTIAAPPTSAPADDLLLALEAISVDPYLRNLVRSYPLNTALQTECVARVIESQHANFKAGDTVCGGLKWRTIQQHDGSGLRKIDPNINVSKTAWIGVLGMPGRTAWFGLLDHEVGRLQPGNTLLVSGAAGAVGSLCGQLARLKGAKLVIGTAGGAEKCRIVKEKYGFDECLDYRLYDTTEKMIAALKSVCPAGIDRYFDNTGGHVSSAAYQVMNKYARVALCGQISNYNDQSPSSIPNPFLHCIYTSINIRGFVVSDFVARYNEFYAEMPQLIQSGEIIFDESVVHGIDKIHEAFSGLFTGKNTGKTIVRL